MSEQKYIPALSFRWLTPLYDALIEGPMSALGLRRDLLALAGDLSGKRLLDIGSGTGSLALLAKELQLGSEIFGLDGDPPAGELSRETAEAVAHAAIRHVPCIPRHRVVRRTRGEAMMLRALSEALSR